MEELDLKELFNMFWTRRVQMLLIVLIFVLIGGVYSYIFVTPKYSAYTTLLLATTEDSSNGNKTITSADISLSNNLVATYSELIKSKSVLGEVISNLNIEKQEETLKKNVSVSAVKSTQIIRIDITDEDPYEAKIIANEVAKVFTKQVSERFKINNVQVVDKAEEQTSPSNVNHIKDIVMFVFIGLVVACIYVIIANMLDTTVKAKEDIERKLGLSVLVEIPNCNFDETTKSMMAKKGGKR